MNRKHNIKQYLKIFEKLKQINPHIEFSSDFIIGYPGENNQDFKDTINLITVSYTHLTLPTIFRV